MKQLILIGILLGCVQAYGESVLTEELVEYTWKYKGLIHGTIKVPTGYKEETVNYREGIVTYLRYPDGSSITLQHGGMFQIPMKQGENYLLIKTAEQKNKKMRQGKTKPTGLFWREDNYLRQEHPDQKMRNLWDLFPPNIAFDNVSEKKLHIFNQALDSFTYPVIKKNA